MQPPTVVLIATAWPWFFPLVAVVTGACIGSFLNVVIMRLPAGESVATPRSHCKCGATIPWFDNLPVLSWLILRGRARCCGARFSFRYAFVEMITAALFLACWMNLPPAKAVVGMAFCSVLIAATFIDLDHMIIPDAFTIWSGVAGVALSFLIPSLHDAHSHIFAIDSMRSGVAALQGMMIGSGLVLWIALLAEAVLKKEAMGFGDVKFVGMIGAFSGWQGAVFSVFGGAVVGTVWFVVMIVLQKATNRSARDACSADDSEEGKSVALGMPIPFGPMLAIAACLHFLFFQHATAEWFIQFSRGS